jgi:glutathione-specific gamma-glutamylcyclotransferase
MSAPARDLWVFGYGSLMWRPGFAYAEARRGRLIGYRRCFCIYSVHHRGTPQRPGMVLGLDRGGACEGIAFRVVAADAAATRRYLREREQVYGVYRDICAPIELIEGPLRQVSALTHIAERSHPNYARLTPKLQARLIRGGKGISGANLDYLANTLRHLAELGIRERQLERLLVMVGPHALRRAGGEGISAGAATMVAAERSRPTPDVALERRRRFAYRLRLE